MRAQHDPLPGIPPDPRPWPGRGVLVVDDENSIRDLMSRWLKTGGYAVASAAGADEALGLMTTCPPAVVLCDIRMPGHDGLWLADRIRQQHPETAVIMATGIQDVDAAAESLRHGAVDYLTKPFGRDRLRDAIVRGIEWHRTAIESRGWRDRLEREVEARYARLAAILAESSIDSDEAIDGMLAALSAGEPEALAHARRVAALAVRVAQALRLPVEEIAATRRGALLHDLGKLMMPDALLRKPAPLTRDEQAIIRRHPQLGSDLVSGHPFLESVGPIIRDTRERPDGTGYPAGTQGDLSVAARIVSAVDAYDTMMQPRVFRDALPPADALLELERCSGTQFDPQIVQVLKTLVAH
jgi:putative two-component system response regulator